MKRQRALLLLLPLLLPLLVVVGPVEVELFT